MHEYKDAWVSVVGEELLCRRELTNWEDRIAVTVTKDPTIVTVLWACQRKYHQFVYYSWKHQLQKVDSIPVSSLNPIHINIHLHPKMAEWIP